MSAPKRNSIICNEDSNEYFVNYNEVKVLKNGLNFTSLKVKVFPFFSTSLKVKVLKLLLKYSNALLLLRYCTTLIMTMTFIAQSIACKSSQTFLAHHLILINFNLAPLSCCYSNWHCH